MSAALLAQLLQPGLLLYAGGHLLVLIAYAGIGGVLAALQARLLPPV
jgi:hypothetical protein